VACGVWRVPRRREEEGERVRRNLVPACASGRQLEELIGQVSNFNRILPENALWVPKPSPKIPPLVVFVLDATHRDTPGGTSFRMFGSF